MEGIFGERDWHGVPQPQDERVDELLAKKSVASGRDPPGARIQVWIAS